MSDNLLIKPLHRFASNFDREPGRTTGISKLCFQKLEKKREVGREKEKGEKEEDRKGDGEKEEDRKGDGEKES